MTLHREPVEIPRRRLSKAEMLSLFIAQEGRCACGLCDREKLMPGEIDEQHDPPHDLRKNDPDYDGKPNVLVRRICHKVLTKSKDLPIITKARHQAGGPGSQQWRRAKRGPTLKSGKKLQGRGFPSKEERARAKAWKKERER